MVDAPCSRIGHIYRKFAPFPNPGVGDFVGRVSLQTFKFLQGFFLCQYVLADKCQSPYKYYSSGLQIGVCIGKLFS